MSLHLMRSSLRSPAVGSKGTFAVLGGFNYRSWAIGGLISNLGTWIQRTAQDWLVLTQLSHHNAAALGVVMSLQFAPQVVLLPSSGCIADRLNHRHVLSMTQSAMLMLAVGLGVLTILDVVQLWHVYIFAFLLGCVSAVELPVRQTFTSALVGEADLPKAVSLNSASSSAARLIGPAISGLLISCVGTGWAFMVDAASFLVMLGVLGRLRSDQLHATTSVQRIGGGFITGLRYIWRDAELRAILLMVLFVGSFGLQFQIFISTMSVNVFHLGSEKCGIMTSFLAIGAIAGALFTTWRPTADLHLLAMLAALFGVGCIAGAVTPDYLAFGFTLIVVGFAIQTFITSANSFVQLATDPGLRGRVIAILLVAALIGAPIGAPIVGWAANVLGPRAALGLGAAAGFVAAAIARLASRRRFPSVPLSALASLLACISHAGGASGSRIS
jgi:MFS family permease